MRTLKITLQYDGGEFVGWQRQKEGASIQGLLEESLGRIDGAPVTVVGAGRTDAGVHAIGQVASCTIASSIDLAALQRALNATLHPDIRVTDVEEAPPEFNARYAARAKTYRYLIANRDVVSPFERRYVWRVPQSLNGAAMAAAARALTGVHDFAAFQSSGSDVETSTREIFGSELQVEDEGRSLVYEVTGDGFLRHMVRAIAGTLVEIGAGRRPLTAIEQALRSRDRRDAGPTAPAHGLFLVAVSYGDGGRPDDDQ